jgi:hypothetical protein
MSFAARLFAILLALASTLALAAPAPAGAVTIGIADQKPDMFSDPLFHAAQIPVARIAVGWDVLSNPSSLASLDAWLAGAQQANVEPLISFGHSGLERRKLPTPEQYVAAFKQFRARYPWVRDFATWNEANHCGEPTCHRPQLVAAYYRGLRRACPSCRILAAEVLDMPNMVSWVKDFTRAARVKPRLWGLHNYIDANRGQTLGTRRLLAATSGQIWLTETGGIVSRTNRKRVTFPESATHAATATRFLFQRLIPLSRRITRVYIYHWNIEHRGGTWDSALIGPRGHLRPAFKVVAQQLRVQAARAAARKAPAPLAPPSPPAAPFPTSG